MLTGEGFSLPAEPKPWLWFAVASCILLAATLLQGCAHLSLTQPPQLRVFGAFWASGWAADHGQNPFGVFALTPRANLPDLYDVNLSPPALLPLFGLLSRLEPLAAARAWIVGQAVLFISGSGLLLSTTRNRVRPWQALWVLLAPQVFDSIYLGQDYAVLYVLVVLAWLALRAGRVLTAGVLIGLFVAAKPNFAVWPVFLLIAGAWRPAALALVVAAAASGLAALIYGPQIYAEWLAAVGADSHWMFTTDASLHGVLARLGLPRLGTLLCAGVLGAACLIVRGRRLCVMDASLLALAVGILAAPLAWADYVVFLLPAYLDGRWGRAQIFAALLLTVPAGLILLAMRQQVWIAAVGGAIDPLAVLLIVAGMAMARAGGPQRAAADAVGPRGFRLRQWHATRPG